MALKRGTKIDKSEALPVSFRLAPSHIERLEVLSEYSGKKKTQVIESLIDEEFNTLMKRSSSELTKIAQKVRAKNKA
jgi:predicted DNA-binding protein